MEIQREVQIQIPLFSLLRIAALVVLERLPLFRMRPHGMCCYRLLQAAQMKHCRLTICVFYVTVSEANPKNNPIMRGASLPEAKLDWLKST